MDYLLLVILWAGPAPAVAPWFPSCRLKRPGQCSVLVSPHRVAGVKRRQPGVLVSSAGWQQVEDQSAIDHGEWLAGSSLSAVWRSRVNRKAYSFGFAVEIRARRTASMALRRAVLPAPGGG